MLAAERRNLILEKLQDEKKVIVSEAWRTIRCLRGDDPQRP